MAQSARDILAHPTRTGTRYILDKVPDIPVKVPDIPDKVPDIPDKDLVILDIPTKEVVIPTKEVAILIKEVVIPTKELVIPTKEADTLIKVLSIQDTRRKDTTSPTTRTRITTIIIDTRRPNRVPVLVT